MFKKYDEVRVREMFESSGDGKRFKNKFMSTSKLDGVKDSVYGQMIELRGVPPSSPRDERRKVVLAKFCKIIMLMK